MSLALPVDRTAVLVTECQNDLIHESNISGQGIGAALAAAVQQDFLDLGLLPDDH